jgi:hypothetical protein
MDVEALLMEDEDDVLEDIDMSQPGMSQDLVDFEDMSPVPSPAKREIGGVPTPGRAGAPSPATAPPPSFGAPGATRDEAPDALAMDAEGAEGEDADGVGPADVVGDRDAGAPAHRHSRRSPRDGDDADDRRVEPPAWGSSMDEEMRDQHTFVPLEPSEVRLAERICRRVDEPKKHLVRLLIREFGAALAEGALRQTERAFEADRARRRGGDENRTKTSNDDDDGGGLYFDPGDGGPPRRRTPGGVFIRVLRSRAPEKEFKAVMRRSAEIDKLLRKQMEAKDDRGDDDERTGRRNDTNKKRHASSARSSSPDDARGKRARATNNGGAFAARERRDGKWTGGRGGGFRGDARGRGGRGGGGRGGGARGGGARGGARGGGAAAAGRPGRGRGEGSGAPPPPPRRSNTAYADDV